MVIVNHPVTSREYKLILKSDRFKDRSESSAIFWELVEALIKQEGGQIHARQNEEKLRRTWYLDTPNLDLRCHNFNLRVREEKDEKKKYKVTLKYRGPDRYLSASQDVSSPEEGETKFEEDVLPPFISKFSHSTSLKFKNEPDLNQMNDLIKLFPDLEYFALPGHTPLQPVNNFVAREIAHYVGQFNFDQVPIVKACLNFWYLPSAESDLPQIVEFSFDYDLDKALLEDPTQLEQFPVPVVTGAYRMFQALQGQTEWLNPDGTTKTAFAYEVTG
jgi:hypothetical protein